MITSKHINQRPQFCSKTEKFCNEIGVRTDSMFPNSGHPALGEHTKATFRHITSQSSTKGF